LSNLKKHAYESKEAGVLFCGVSSSLLMLPGQTVQSYHYDRQRDTSKYIKHKYILEKLSSLVIHETILNFE